jgi:hypothetical protein
MKKQVLIQFSGVVTEEEQAFFDKVAEMATEIGLEPLGFGGGVKNPKPTFTEPEAPQN